jgi:peptide/nickel transport system ATP-binding protein
MTNVDSSKRVLEVRSMTTRFATAHGTVTAVDGVSLHLDHGEMVAVVGESGSGKSVMARSAMGFEQMRPSATITGSSKFEGRELLGMRPADLRALWGKDIGFVQQNPLAALNPVLRVGDQLAEVLRVHLGLSKKVAAARAVELLAEVRIPDPRRRADQYPHELSGGMRQRVCVAIAIACKPRLLIADEPTTALDVTVQRQVLDLVAMQAEQLGMATLLITHNLGVATQYADRVVVMYGGRLVEELPAANLVEQNQHPYTRALLRSVPRVNDRFERLETIGGRPPDLRELPVGCRFAPRCPHAFDRCLVEDPAATPVSIGHTVACHLVDEPAGVR